MTLAGACAQPSVDALVVWIEESTSRFEAYDSGERRSLPLVPDVPGSDTSRLQLAVVPGGGGFVVSPPNDKLVWLDLRGGGHTQLGDGPWDGLEDRLLVFDSGVAVARRSADRQRALILPTHGGASGPIWLEPLEELPLGTPIVVRSAGAAGPMLYVYADASANGSSASVQGTVLVYELGTGRDGMPTLEVRDRQVLYGRPAADSSGSLITGKCADAACITPDGEAMIVMEVPEGCVPTPTGCALPPPSECRLLRYRWRARDEHTPSVEALRLPDDCDVDHDGDPLTPEVPPFGVPKLLAALDRDLVLLEDDLRIFRADLDAGTWISLPKLGTDQMRVLPAERGRAALLLGSNLQVIRADRFGLRVHSAHQMGCGELDGTVVSPSGEWLLTVCVPDLGFIEVPTEESEQRTVVRISPLGLEQWDGISMRPLAIDDEGSALLYSFARGDDEQEPRGLFVLDAEGRLSRVDTLEPTPQRLTSPIVPSYYFAARSVER